MASRASSSGGALALHLHPLYILINSARLLLLSGWQEGTEPKSPRFDFFFLVLLDALVQFVGELQLAVDVASIRVIWVRTDLEVLRRLPLQDPIPPGRAVAFRLDLLHHRPNVTFVSVPVLRQKHHELFIVHEMTCDHDKGQPAVVANVLAPSQGLHHVVHQRALLKSIYKHKLYSLRFAGLRVREISSRTTINLTLRHALWPRVRA